MTQRKKVLILVVLMFGAATAFGVAQRAGLAEVAAFFAFSMLGLLIAIPVVALSRGESRRR